MVGKIAVVCALTAVALGQPARGVGEAKMPAVEALTNYTFDQYFADFRREYAGRERLLRKRLFEEKLEAIRRHNAQVPKPSWTAGVNEYTDWTDLEWNRLMGYRKEMGRARAAAATQQFDAAGLPPLHQLPTDVDWRTKKVVTAPKDQGACGSCWSFASAETIESHWAIKTGTLNVLSEQNILDCTANPRHCGGTGGCGGAIAELAFDAMASKGIALEKDYPYQSGSGRDYTCRYDPVKTPSAANVTGHVTLPSNQYAPLMQAVATLGPIAITVAANTGWQLYVGGIFDGCDQKNPDLNHAVQLVGYGHEASNGKDYWLVRNSWGTTWGEKGYIRILRTASEETRCGDDTTPSDGTACDGDPTTAHVCGTCGILYDNAYPTLGGH
eukprot:TRINITY_DN7540_c2_g1_i1.p1 TRINITY_DN7540_c2_g1~~TRINITY_DN7540_c2_g1_i1.p1  ORF type:complete len:396 (+),score=95.85 TRINITY_DN7540_c2_g1_i1:34-1188(+)